MEEELDCLERHQAALEGSIRSLESLEAFGNDAAELAQGLSARGPVQGPMQQIAESIEVLTELLKDDVADCQRLQATQVVAAFEEIAGQIGNAQGLLPPSRAALGADEARSRQGQAAPALSPQEAEEVLKSLMKRLG
mmetsp:Transcript_7015/g.12469  ORF Transcript_7015/g.12469 Transcript_7015/m.12469 type:complete len:137 (-) Transcript_7015:287-697(-)|eukprot:CAMPEP_0197650056 /NCGR_PEP_ID=MMETSP1338-20131121/30719_1 /TAXON_ID=43686 ORGANISM="Pelagodinium beii, Strain RCC1491" /NCGR_SAMPLE_ID=MMETSP1338 /ASSEMBLY_ACC=CAM_ASM_000754 /LENGTH=136 /DNA_ID=CAMNT_0043224401 /DNA_START=102 /DNA_END=512 /DNA_ORIENTATION=-